MIIRAPTRKRYVVISAVTVEDERLSWKARGLLAYLLSKPDSWEVSTAHLVTQAPDGRTAVLSGLRELADAGYIVRTQGRRPGGRWDDRSVQVFETPQGTGNGFPCSGEDDALVGTVNGLSVDGSTVNGLSVDGKSTTSKELLPVSTEIANAPGAAPPEPFRADFEVRGVRKASEYVAAIPTGAAVTPVRPVSESHRCHSRQRPVSQTTLTGVTAAPQDVIKASVKASLTREPSLIDETTAASPPATLDASSRSKPFEDDFEALWKHYPRKVEKQAAFKAYVARRREKVPHADLLAATQNYAKTTAGAEERFVKHGKTFFGSNRPYADFVEPT